MTDGQELPTPEELKQEFPMTSDLVEIKESREKEIADIITGESDKLLLVIGPCSADHEDPVLKYTHWLSVQQKAYKDKFVIVPRVYTGKPRTNSKGYKGISTHPGVTGRPDLAEGLRKMRKLQIDVIRETGLTSADEMLNPFNLPYVDDLLSYHAIGARSVGDQSHREFPSSLDVPVGMKNPESGDLSVMMHAIDAAQSPQSINYNGRQKDTVGNPLTHAILRGARNQYGRSIPNYHYEDLKRVISMYNDGFRHLSNRAIIVDCNHDNSDKDYREQPRIAQQVLCYRNESECMDVIKGLMIESYIHDGKQKVKDDGSYVKGQSLTDGCIGIEKTDRLLEKIAEMV